MLLPAQPHPFQNRLCFPLAQRVPRNAAGNTQILDWIQFVLHAILMGDVGDLRAILFTVAADISSIPANVAGSRRHQPADDSQQAGLAASVWTKRLEKAASGQRKAQPAKQPAFAARTA